jgi:hypothetical protein
MKNAVFWDIKTQFVPHRRQITSPLKSSAGQYYVRSHGGDYEKCRLLGCDVLWLFVTRDDSEERIAFIMRVEKISQLETTLAVTRTLTNNVAPISLILFAMLMERCFIPKH